ncbi:endosialidase [uncultured Mediterranean phage uvMED]|nr:endosialidase [uncultured Mediterranean phage uvMED]
MSLARNLSKFKPSSSGLVETADIADDAVTTAKVDPAQTDITSVGTLSGLTTSGNISLADNGEIRVGTGNDLVIKHNASNTFMTNTTGALIINGDDIAINKANGSTGMFSTAGDQIRLYHNGTKMIETTSAGVTVTGNVAFPSGNGIDFSTTGNSSGSMDNELFDDYEEGTWNWTLTDGTHNATATAGGWGTGYYRKIGGLAYVTAYIRISTLGSASGASMEITGLPFTSLSGNTIGTASGFACGRATNLDYNAGNVLGFQVGAGVSEVSLREWNDTGGTTSSSASSLSGDAIFIMTVIYPTA